MSIEDSQTLAWLLEEVNKTSSLDKRKIVGLLNLIHAPAKLHGLFLVLENLPAILEKAKSIHERDRDHPLGPDFDAYHETCRILLGCKDSLKACKVLGALFPYDQAIWKQIHGFIDSHPLYSCLCFKSCRPELADIYLQLQAQVLLASQHVASSGNDFIKLLDNFRSVRKLSEWDNRKELQKLPAQILVPLEYLAVARQGGADTNIHKVGAILQQANLGRQLTLTTHREPPQNIESRRKSILEDLEDCENPDSYWTGENIIPRGVLTEGESLAYGKFGGSDTEFTGGFDDVPVPVVDERVISQPTLAELAFQGKQRSNQEALKNQFNPLGWNELNQFDIHILCKFLYSDIPPVNDAPASFILRDYLSLMFWLCAPLERVLKLRKFNGAPEPESPEGLYLKDDSILIARLHSPGPLLASQSLNHTSKLAQEVEHYCDIPLPSIAHTETLVNACRQPLPAVEPVDEETIDLISSQIESELGSLNKTFGTRLSFGRICHYWLHALGTEKGEDPPSAILYFGHQEKYSVARLHYTCAPAQRMEKNYRSICSKRLQEVELPGGFPDEELVNGDIFLGTPFCPKRKSIQNLVQSLISAVKDSRPTRKQFNSIKNFHNQYTLYTACLISFATTYRAVRNPSLYEKDIHFATGLGVISDKDDSTFYHSRFVWIAEVCRKQMIYYRRHLQRLYEIFGVMSPALFSLFKKLDLYGRPLNLFRIPVKNNFLEELRPGVIENSLKKNHKYDLPVNAHRHYLKSELMISGCPLEVLEAQMGHWELGQEPWNRLSNLPPKEFCQRLDRHLSPILERDGWIAIKGYDL